MAYHTRRRTFLKGIGAAGIGAGLTGFAGCIGDDDDVPVGETIKLGVIQPTSGDLIYYGQISLMGFYSGLAYKYDDVEPSANLTPGVFEIDPEDGPTYEIHLRDTEFNPDLAQSEAEDLVADEEIDFLIGTTSSDSARRVIDTVVDVADVPIIIGPAADADVTVDGDVCHPLAFRASEHTAMDARAGGVYAAEEAGVENVAIFAADYPFGHSVAANYKEVLEDAGVTVQEPRFVEVGHTEFEGLFDEAVANGAEGFIGGFTFITLPAFLTTAMAYDVQIFGGFAELVTTQIVAGAVEAALGEDFTAEDIRDAGLGPFTSRYHWNQYDNPINDAFTEMHIDAYGMVPDLFSGGTFVAGTALVEAIEAAGSTDGGEIAEALTGMTVQDTPKGEGGYTFQEFNNQAASAMTVAWPEPTAEEYRDTWDASIMPGAPIEELPAEDVMVPQDEATCDHT